MDPGATWRPQGQPARSPGRTLRIRPLLTSRGISTCSSPRVSGARLLGALGVADRGRTMHATQPGRNQLSPPWVTRSRPPDFAPPNLRPAGAPSLPNVRQSSPTWRAGVHAADVGQSCVCPSHPRAIVGTEGEPTSLSPRLSLTTPRGSLNATRRRRDPFRVAPAASASRTDAIAVTSEGRTSGSPARRCRGAGAKQSATSPPPSGAAALDAPTRIEGSPKSTSLP